MAKFCTECGTVINEDKKFCSNCGASVTTDSAATVAPLNPVCPKCGAAVESGERFCTACGAAAEAKTTAEQPAQEQQIQSVQQEIHEQAQTYIQPKPLGAFKYWLWLFVMLLPLTGLAVSILWSGSKVPSDRRSLARALVFFGAVWLVFLTAFAVVTSLFLQAKDLVDVSFKLFGIKFF